MLTAIYKNAFIKDINKAKKRGKDIEKLVALVQLLLEKKALPEKNRNHRLQGTYKGFWECHIEPDWLLIYYPAETEIVFARTGTHSDLF
ncbi:type II toxin-antitoxin system YafQ family toxin [Candidatus Dependentiae bacterium]|nr:type II toxin-antitoxin system YafQ family toxin [Candidatus Dependentiae bacterium]